MDIDQRLAIEHACARLCHEYARAIDFRDYENFVLLFAPDALLDVGGPLSGRSEILASLTRRSDEIRSRHVMTNIVVDALSEDEARGTAYLSLYLHVGEASLGRDAAVFDGPAAVGHYEDRYRLSQGAWVFAQRRLFLAFRNDTLLPG